MQLITGHFEGDGSAIYLPIGFIPDYFYMVDMVTDGESIHYEWWKDMPNVDADYGGGLTEDDDGTNAWIATGSGIAEYDTGTEAPTVTEWTQAVSSAATARTATARGTLIKPTDAGLNVDGVKADRSLILECVTAGTGDTTEPVYPVSIGGQVTDGSTVFEVVNQATLRAGYQGVTIAAAIQTNAYEYFFRAELADQATDFGDVDAWPGGIYGS